MADNRPWDHDNNKIPPWTRSLLKEHREEEEKERKQDEREEEHKHDKEEEGEGGEDSGKKEDATPT